MDDMSEAVAYSPRKTEALTSSGRPWDEGGQFMLLRSGAVLCAAVTAVVLGAPHASAASTFQAHWSLNEVGSDTAFDSSGNGNDGANQDVVGDGDGYIFNGSSSRVVVPNDPTLNSGPGDFSWGVTLSMTKAPSSGETYDVLRKGLAGVKGGDYKLEITSASGRGKARCVFNSVLASGKRANIAVTGATRLADGKQHTITCAKTANAITVTVDSAKPNTKTISGGLGTVSNTYDLALGAKAEPTAKSGFDWFDGEIFEAWVATGS
jgi:hypothetical protein